MTDTKDELLKLAERVEALTGPDPHLDAVISRSTGEEHTLPLAYTASLDAAMTLVPEGWRPLIDCTPDDKPVVELFADEETIRPIKRGCAATPALALTAASLRALASKDHDHD